MGVNIMAMGSYLPEQTLTNDDFRKFVDTNDEWIRTRTGICSRHMAGWEPVWYMGKMAAQKAIEKAGIKPDEIGLVIVSTITSDFLTPSIASILQYELGISNAYAFDLNAACSGFVYMLDAAHRYLETDENLKYVLVVSSEALSRFVDYSDRGTCILFGDGAAAAVIGRSEKMYSSFLASDGSGARKLFARNVAVAPQVKQDNDFDDGFPEKPQHQLYQDGKEVYKFAVKALPKAFNAAAEKIGITSSDIDWFVPHQANVRIIETAAKNLGTGTDKFIVTLDHHGNTSSASIPLALCEAIEKGTVQRGQKLALVGFGAGLTYGSIILEY
ncbi:MAG: ketoacyl-ACP synthase III [Ruminococcus sp.]|nr:ketoacyl-ACP synthase III [Ruminococcus sp.]MDE6784963.1 ketoacyl-ACP synthase III [Ruminococcus sp.]